MNDRLKVLRLFGHWEDAKIQGTDRTYRFYARHPLDRILTICLVLVVWIALFLRFFCRYTPGSIGILLRGIGMIIYLPADIAPLLRWFIFWMAIPSVGYIMPNILEHCQQRRILRGELTVRQGILAQIGYWQDHKYPTCKEYRFLLKVQEPGGKIVCEVYKMPQRLFKEFEAKQASHACRVELVLLPPKKPKKRKHHSGFSDEYADRLHVRVETIFWLETLSSRCKPVQNFLFISEYGPNGRKDSGSKKKPLSRTKSNQSF